MTAHPPTVVILAGGSNSRFWPLKEKSLFPFRDVPLLELQLASLREVGFRQVVVVANSTNRESIERIGRQFADTLNVRVVIQDEARGMGHALLSLRPLLDRDSPPTPVYVCQVHDVFEPSLHARMLQAHFRDPSATLLASYRVHSYFPGGYLVVNSDMSVSNIIEKPAIGAEPSDLVNIVAHVHPDLARLLDRVAQQYATEAGSDDHYERAMASLMQESRFIAMPYEGRWHPMKYPWHVLDVMKYYLDQLREHIADDAVIAQSAQMTGPVYISNGVRILEGATIVGPAYIGPNTLIGQYSHVRQSMIGSHCVVGLGSEVNRSYIGRYATMHSAKALDSVLAGGTTEDEHVNLSAGVITANLRSDAGHISSDIKGERVDTERTKFGSIIGEGAFIGIGAMLMPGVKVGANAIVGASTLVRSDVPDSTLLYVKQQYMSKPLDGRDHSIDPG